MAELNELEVKVRADDPSVLAQVVQVLGAMDGVTVTQYSCPRCKATHPQQFPTIGELVSYCAHPFHEGR